MPFVSGRGKWEWIFLEPHMEKNNFFQQPIQDSTSKAYYHLEKILPVWFFKVGIKRLRGFKQIAENPTHTFIF